MQNHEIRMKGLNNMTDYEKPEYYSAEDLAKRACFVTMGLTGLIFLILLFLSFIFMGSALGLASFFVMAGITLIGSSILGFIAYQIAKKLLQPFKPLVSELRKASGGDLTADFSPLIKGGIGVLAYNIQEMMHAFKDIVERIIVTTIHNVLSFGEEFKKLIARTAESSIAQSNQAETIAAAASQMNAAAETVKNHTETALSASEQAMRSAEVGAATVSDTTEAFRIAGSSTNELSNRVEELYVSVQEIDNIVSFIDELADQSNLLALNAAIEAARAGVYGKGFAVVAGEVRNLAEKTRDATKEISDRIETVKEKSASAKKSMDQSMDSFARMQDRVSGLGTNLESIIESVQQVNRTMAFVSESMKEQTDSSSQVADSIRHIAISAQELKEMSLTVSKKAGDFENNSEQILELVGAFKIGLHHKAQIFVEELSRSSELMSFDQDRIERYLSGQIRRYPWVELLYLTDGKGRQLTGNISASRIDPAVKGKDWSKRPWFLEPATTGRPYISGLYRSMATNDFCFTASLPIIKDKKTIGVIAADINFRALSNLD
jgi:methyl-accepting chemotaxis protein